MAEHRFPELDEPKLFLASPGDVAYLRRMSQNVVNTLEGRMSDERRLAMLAWETDVANTPLNDGAPIQEQIHRPDDPKCRGLVAFFGEKIGQPLANDFPTDMLQDLFSAQVAQHATSKQYRLVHPWDPSAASNGGFPLTGSTFEVLCAFAAERRRGKSENSRDYHTFLRFVGPPDCWTQDDPGRADWGNSRLRRQIETEFAGDLRVKTEHQISVLDQLVQLKNFFMFLRSLGLEPKLEPDEEKIESDLRQWLGEKYLLVRDPLKIDPFKGLRSYDVVDHEAFYGRADEKAAALRRLEKIQRDPDALNLYWVLGSSGSGKSSFLRAGVVGGLLYSTTPQATHAYVIERPNALLSKVDASTQPPCPLRTLFAKTLDALVSLSRLRRGRLANARRIVERLRRARADGAARLGRRHAEPTAPRGARRNRRRPPEPFGHRHRSVRGDRRHA